MQIPLSWIKDFLPLHHSPEELSYALTLAGLEVEGIEEEQGECIFHIGLTPNLGHCMSILGIARELSAILQIPLKYTEYTCKETSESISKHVQISIEDPLQCHQYSCRLVQNVKVAPSPSWLKQKLEACGLRSVNNVVDIGNLVMLEIGQPLHLFDFDQISKGKILITSHSDFEEMTTLDLEKRSIPKGSLLICDPEKPIAFAGVIGESTSAISEATHTVLIEAACFTPQAVRKTSKLLNLRTDSSLRFERGIDPLALANALNRAAYLLETVAEGRVCKGIASQVSSPYTPTKIQLDCNRTNRLLGTELSIREIVSLLERLKIKLLEESDSSIQVEIPSYRNDLKKEIDLIEEVGRMFGFNNIPRKKTSYKTSTLLHAPLYLFEEKVRHQLIGQGLQECLTCDLISPKLAAITVEKGLNLDSQISVLYPASIDQSILRHSLLPGLLEVVKFNLDRQNSTLACFEVGHIHFKEGTNYFEETAAAILLTGDSSVYHYANKPKEVDFFDLKGYVENFLSAILSPEYEAKVSLENSHLQNFHPGRQARIKIGSTYLGALAEVHPKHLRELGISQRVYYAELHLNELLSLKAHCCALQPLAQFPGSQRDWTIQLSDKTPIGILLEEIKAFSSPILETVFLLDLYKSEKIGKDRKNATFRFHYRDPKKTISYDEVEKEHERITLHLAEKLSNAVL